MKNNRVGPKNITRSVLEERPRKKKRRPVEDDEDTPVRKTKKLKTGSRELVVISGAKSDMTAKDRKSVKSFFGSRSGQIIDMLKIGDQDSGMALLKKTLLMTVIRVLPAAEKVLTESGTTKGTYQFVTLISQIRELMTDIQADGDRKYLARSVMESIMKPAFMDLAQEIINSHHQFRKESGRMIVPSKTQEFSADLQNLAMNLAKKMNDKYNEIGVKMEEALKS